MDQRSLTRNNDAPICRDRKNFCRYHKEKKANKGNDCKILKRDVEDLIKIGLLYATLCSDFCIWLAYEYQQQRHLQVDHT